MRRQNPDPRPSPNRRSRRPKHPLPPRSPRSRSRSHRAAVARSRSPSSRDATHCALRRSHARVVGRRGCAPSHPKPSSRSPAWPMANSQATRHAGAARVACALLSRWGHFAMSRSRTSGFTLVEMAVVILIFGLLFTFSIPAYQRINGSYQLKGATENLAAQLRMARSKAMSTGMDQPMHFTPNYLNSDYHIHYLNGFIPAKWKFPRGVTYYSIGLTPTM